MISTLPPSPHMAPIPHHNVMWFLLKHSFLPRSKEVVSSSHCLNYFIIAAALADVAIALIAAIGINLSATRGKSPQSSALEWADQVQKEEAKVAMVGKQP